MRSIRQGVRRTRESGVSSVCHEWLISMLPAPLKGLGVGWFTYLECEAGGCIFLLFFFGIVGGGAARIYEDLRALLLERTDPDTQTNQSITQYAESVCFYRGEIFAV